MLLSRRVVQVRLADHAVLVEEQNLDDMRAHDALAVDRNAVDAAQHTSCTVNLMCVEDLEAFFA